MAEERLRDLAREHGKDVSIHLFGQEVNAETYAITKADLLLKGEGHEAENFLPFCFDPLAGQLFSS